jgi:hypothetical protein
MNYIYESPDKGTTVYRRELGSPASSRTLVEFKYDYYTSYTNEIGGEKRSAEVCQRGDGVWCVEKSINGEVMEMEAFPNRSENYAETMAENFVLLV